MAAYNYIQKCADVTPRMAARLIEELKRFGIEYVVAPYEADAQMAWLSRMGLVAAVVTEDSDLLLFGCKRVLYKLEKEGFTEEICIDRLSDTTELDFSLFSYQKVQTFTCTNGLVPTHVYAFRMRLLAIDSRNGLKDGLQIPLKISRHFKSFASVKGGIHHQNAHRL